MRAYRLLIVDDDAVDQQLFRRLLVQRGPDDCRVQQALNGTEGLAALRAEIFDCVLLAFSLPDMTGPAFLAAAAVDGVLPCAIVVVTGQSNEALAVEVMKHGAQDYLVKDQLNAADLWRSLTQAMTQVELHQRLAAALRDLSAAHLALEQEITVRKAAEVESRAAKNVAEQANNAKTRFVAMVTHEFRTPLNGILGYAQLLRIDGGLSAGQDSHVGSMILAGKHLLAIIDRVLDFASIEAGRLEIQPAEISVSDLAEACVAFVSPMVTERGLGLRVVSAHDAPQHIVADSARLQQVALNLLGNAVKYTDAGSVELRVLAGASPGGLRIEVADTGRGVDAANRHRLFLDFERLDAATSAEGAGLGLAIATRIVRLMGGTIGYLPNPNGGSVFWIEVPMTDPPSKPQSHPVKQAAAPSGRRVLLVDDMKINRDIIGAFLNAAGHTAIMAESGEESVRMAAEQKFDLILMDVRMPDVDGLEATRRIRALPAPSRQVPILALTAYTFPGQVAQCLEAGMDGHLPKPIDYETLIGAVDGAFFARTPVSGSGNPQVPFVG
jgi:signal transduction histidine kinase